MDISTAGHLTIQPNIEYGSTISVSYGNTVEKATGPITVAHVDARKILALDLANAPWEVSAEEDAEGVRWVRIGCQRRTLDRWRERGDRYIAVHTKDAKERARLAKGLKVTLDAIAKAFDAK